MQGIDYRALGIVACGGFIAVWAAMHGNWTMAQLFLAFLSPSPIQPQAGSSRPQS